MTVHGENLRVYKRAMTMLSTLLVLIVMVGTTTGCGDSCTELANVICRCGRTENDQNACLQRVSSDNSVGTPNAEQKQECERLLDECTCDKLEQGDLAACGLSYE